MTTAGSDIETRAMLRRPARITALFGVPQRHGTSVHFLSRCESATSGDLAANDQGRLIEPLLDVPRHDLVENLLAVGDRLINDLRLFDMGNALFHRAVERLHDSL